MTQLLPKGVLFLLLLGAPCFNTWATQCEPSFQHMWKLDLVSKTITSAAHSKKSEVFCNLDVMPSKNLLLTIKAPQGLVVYERKLYVSLDRHFDFEKTKGSGRRPASTVHFSTYIPQSLQKNKIRYTVQVTSLTTKEILANGVL